MKHNTTHTISYIKTVLWLVVFCGSVGCNLNQGVSPAQEAQYRLILSDAPCFEGVCPGMEGRDWLTEQLKRSPLVEAVYDNGGIPVNFVFHNPDPDAMNDRAIGGVVLQFGQNTEGEFEVLESLFFKMPSLSLSTVIDVLGQPEAYLLVTGCGMGTQVFGLITYPSQGVYLMITYETRHPERERLDANTTVTPIYTTFQNFDTSLLNNLEDNMLESVAFDLSPQVDTTYLMSLFRPWPADGSFPQPSVDLCSR